MTNAILRGKPDAGNPHVRFDEGEVASAKPRRGSLLYYAKKLMMAFCAFAVAFCVKAVEFSYEFNSDGADTITLIGVVGRYSTGHVVIPERYDGYIVTRLGLSREYEDNYGVDSFWEGRDDITSVTIPGTVKKIDEEAFSNCHNLKSVVLSEGVETVCASAFVKCALEDLTIPASLKTCEGCAFGSNPLKSIRVVKGSANFEIKNGLLIDKQRKKVVLSIRNQGKVIIPDGVEVIGESAFQSVVVTAMEFPRSLREIEQLGLGDSGHDSHVKNQFTVSELDFSQTSLSNVGCGALMSLSNLKAIIFPRSLKWLGKYTLYNCKSLRSVYFVGEPVTLTEEGWFARSVRKYCDQSGLNIPPECELYGYELSNCLILPAVTTCVPRSKGWDDIVASGTWQGRPIKFIDGEIPQGGDDDTADWTVAHNFSGVVYDAGENCVGMIQIATKKATKKGVGVSGTMMLQDGKKITLKSMTVAPEGGVLNVAWTVKGYGKLNVTVGAEGFSGQFEDGGSVESQELDEDTGVLKASITMTYIDKKTGKMKTKKITFGGFVSGGEGVGTAQTGKKDPIKEVEFTIR